MGMNSNIAFLQGSRKRDGRSCHRRQPWRRSMIFTDNCLCRFDRLLREDYNVCASWLGGRVPVISSDCHGGSAGSEVEPEGLIVLACPDSLRLAGSQTLSAIIGNGSVNNSAAIDAFPCIEYEKEVREPLQHHHSLAFRTFHCALPGWLRSQLMANLSKSCTKLSFIVFSIAYGLRNCLKAGGFRELTVQKSPVRQIFVHCEGCYGREEAWKGHCTLARRRTAS